MEKNNKHKKTVRNGKNICTVCGPNRSRPITSGRKIGSERGRGVWTK